MLITRSRLSSTRDIRLFISFREAMADVQRFDLLDPAEVARFGGIEIVAQGVVEGFLSGIHRSPFRGFSVEFTEHRAYQPGDELRYLDWKILARADRLFVKQFEEETNLRAMILVDASRSMAWRGDPSRLTKRGYADRLVAALALILLRQRDATGLMTFDEAVRQVIPLHVMDPAELDLVGPPEVRLRDPESAASVVVRPRELAGAYAATVRREIAGWRTACRRHGVAYHHIRTDMPFGMALRLLA